VEQSVVTDSISTMACGAGRTGAVTGINWPTVSL